MHAVTRIANEIVYLIRPVEPVERPSISTELQVAMSDVITGQQSPEAALDQAWNKLKP
jgi:hypothetical protein